MSDLNNTDLENEDTSMLFVSGQKKKKAEEEARKKAEEEEAKRKAAEAQIKKMEEEVEERKRKAEEEKAALENAMREDTVKKGRAGNDEKDSGVKKAENKPGKKPLIIGIAAAVIVVIILIAVLSGKDSGGISTGSAADISALDFNASYKSQKEEMDIEFLYPDSLYPQVTEKMGSQDNLIIHFAPDNSKDVTMDVILKKVLSKTGKIEFAVNNSAFWSPDEMINKLKNYAEEQLKVIDQAAVISDEKISEYNENEPGRYYYTFSFSSESIKSGAAACWFEKAGNDTYKFVLASFTNEKEGVEAVQKLRDEFYDKNSEGALEMPGANPPESTAADDRIDIEAIHAGLHVPKDRFIRNPRTTNFDMYTDKNGAYFYVMAEDLNFPADQAPFTEETKKAAEDMVEGEKTPAFSVEGRTRINGEWSGSYTYVSEYNEKLGGIDYWEKVCGFYWMDVTTGEDYWVRLAIGCPKKDKDIYNTLLDNMWNNMEDI